ncbi:hypothetical protein Drorol1_Dr00021030 [Drosera rotundifolia]
MLIFLLDLASIPLDTIGYAPEPYRFFCQFLAYFGIHQMVLSLSSHYCWCSFSADSSLTEVIQMNIEESARRQIAKELKINQSLECPFAVACYQSFYVNGAFSIILEYMDGGSLADFLRKVKTIPEPYLAAISKQVDLCIEVSDGKCKRSAIASVPGEKSRDSLDRGPISAWILCVNADVTFYLTLTALFCSPRSRNFILQT